MGTSRVTKNFEILSVWLWIRIQILVSVTLVIINMKISSTSSASRFSSCNSQTVSSHHFTSGSSMAVLLLLTSMLLWWFYYYDVQHCREGFATVVLRMTMRMRLTRTMLIISWILVIILICQYDTESYSRGEYPENKNSRRTSCIQLTRLDE